ACESSHRSGVRHHRDRAVHPSRAHPCGSESLSLAPAAGGPLVPRAESGCVKFQAQCALFAVLLAVSGRNGDMLRAQTTETLRTAANASASPAVSPQEKSPAKKHRLGPLDVSGNWRMRGEGWNWFDAGKGDSNYGFGHSLLRVALSQTS